MLYLCVSVTAEGSGFRVKLKADTDGGFFLDYPTDDASEFIPGEKYEIELKRASIPTETTS